MIYIDADDRKIFEVIFLLSKRGMLKPVKGGKEKAIQLIVRAEA